MVTDERARRRIEELEREIAGLRRIVCRLSGKPESEPDDEAWVRDVARHMGIELSDR